VKTRPPRTSIFLLVSTSATARRTTRHYEFFSYFLHSRVIGHIDDYDQDSLENRSYLLFPISSNTLHFIFLSYTTTFFVFLFPTRPPLRHAQPAFFLLRLSFTVCTICTNSIKTAKDFPFYFTCYLHFLIFWVIFRGSSCVIYICCFSGYTSFFISGSGCRTSFGVFVYSKTVVTRSLFIFILSCLSFPHYIVSFFYLYILALYIRGGAGLFTGYFFFLFFLSMTLPYVLMKREIDEPMQTSTRPHKTPPYD
jgi:hypothetical protein